MSFLLSFRRRFYKKFGENFYVKQITPFDLFTGEIYVILYLSNLLMKGYKEKLIALGMEAEVKTYLYMVLADKAYNFGTYNTGTIF